MINKTIIARKRVLYGEKRYLLSYRLVSEDGSRYGIEVTCESERETEVETVFLDEGREYMLHLIEVLSGNLGFPIALRETIENYI